MHKPASTKSSNGGKKSIFKNPSRVITRPNNAEGGEETEIAAQISVPHEGGWGWVVVTSSLICIAILDGVVYTFGSILQDIIEDLNKSEALIALINSIAVSLYFVSGPLASALINRFGFRACTMGGSVICSCSLFITYFSTHYTTVCIFYGCIAGFGYALINLACSLIVGFYFERLRSIALAISSTGSSIGIMCFFPLNSYLVKIGGWRLVTLLHSGLFGLVYFLGMSFRPLLSLTVTKTGEDPTRTVTYLPTLSTVAVRSRSTTETKLVSTATERLFGAVSNYNFPTAATVVENDQPTSTQAGPSAATTSKLTLKVNDVRGGISRLQLKQVQSALNTQNINKKNIEIEIKKDYKRSSGCCGWLCCWESEAPESRPLYRDDAFYEGRVQNLPEYQKSVMDVSAEARTGIEYRLAVSRAAAASDLVERRGVFTTSVRRVLATMMDLSLMKETSFIMLCLCGFFTYVGFLVPYVYLKDRNSKEGIADSHCTMFVSAIGFSNIIGKLTIGILAYRVDPILLSGFSCIIAGLSTCLSSLSFSLYYQYLYCFLFGFCIASIVCLRSLVLVSLYGLEKLTNATGMILLFQGIGSLVSTPMASALKNMFGYDIAFIVAGLSITLSGLIFIQLKYQSGKENTNITTNIKTVKIDNDK